MKLLPSQEFVYTRTYSKWLEEKGRREYWPETVNRYIDFIRGSVPEVTETELDTARQAIIDMKVMPSMRALQTAGAAAEYDNLCAFNCSFLPLADIRAFSELLYILMCGTGVGFSVESKHVNQLPEISAKSGLTEVIVVEDSRQGWAEAFDKLLNALWLGHECIYDTSGLRPKGARLKTMGGRASGPEPLIRLFDYCTKMFEDRRGKKLKPINCHDIACKTAEIVIVGGVRRSALISLSDLDDVEVAQAKLGQFWETHPHRQGSNNSAAYDEKPDVITFMNEWRNLIESRSGERGIFNREAAWKQMEFSRNRYPDPNVGLNPCISKHSWILTSKGPKQVSELVGNQFEAVVDGVVYPSTTRGFYKTATSQLYKIETEEGYELEATDNHLIRVVDKLTTKTSYSSWKAVKDITPGMLIKLNTHNNYSWSGKGTFDEGWMLGSLLGDGNITKDRTANLDYWGTTKNEMKSLAVGMIHTAVGGRSDLQGCDIPKHDKVRIGSKQLGLLAEEYGMTNESKKMNSKLEKTSSDFTAGFLSGWFDADGSVQGTTNKGVSVRLSSIDLNGLKSAQRMLARLGIISTIYSNRKEAGTRQLPDGNGSSKDYYCQANHELVIANSNIKVFQTRVNFKDSNKRLKLEDKIGSYNRILNRERFTCKVKSITATTIEDVYDATIPGIDSFDANNMHVHNCSEILLKPFEFCNLTSVICRKNDTIKTLKEKVKTATMIGTWQSYLTNFRYIREDWAKNCNEERLLGVSLSGIMDHPILSTTTDEAKKWLATLKGIALATNRRFAKQLNIPISAAITCVKPEGNSSQVVESSSGKHARWSEFYIRRYRISATDPLFKLCRDSGVPNFPDIGEDMSAPSSYVLEFPIASPKGAKTRHMNTAIEQLEHWLMLKEFWCEHNPSFTCYVKNDEWLEVGTWVYKHWDRIAGVSFLPSTDHVYALAPYEEITKEKYEELVATFPVLDFTKLSKYEMEDQTEVRSSPACSGGQCDMQM